MAALAKFNSSPLKSYLPNTRVVFQPPFFSGYFKIRVYPLKRPHLVQSMVQALHGLLVFLAVWNSGLTPVCLSLKVCVCRSQVTTKNGIRSKATVDPEPAESGWWCATTNDRKYHYWNQWNCVFCQCNLTCYIMKILIFIKSKCSIALFGGPHLPSVRGPSQVALPSCGRSLLAPGGGLALDFHNHPTIPWGKSRWEPVEIQVVNK